MLKVSQLLEVLKTVPPNADVEVWFSSYHISNLAPATKAAVAKDGTQTVVIFADEPENQKT
jgi:hypothetical protein